MDILTEKSNTISRCGSFYYQSIDDASKELAEFISHLNWYNKIPSKLKKIEAAVQGGSFVLSYYDVITFSDKDVSWNGIKEALQYRVQGPAARKVNNIYEAAPDTQRYPGRLGNLIINNAVVAEANKEDEYTATETGDTILYPDANSSIILPREFTPKWDIKINENIFIISIIINNKVLLTGQDFDSEFGKITFNINPISLFPSKKIFILCSQVRFKNIYNHILGATSIYGDMSHVLEYYRNSQSCNTLKLACAQFSGLSVVNNDCKILKVKIADANTTYVTNNGIIDVRYKHKTYKEGTTLKKNTIVGGDSIFCIYNNYDNIRNFNIRVSLNGVLPISGLYASTMDTMRFKKIEYPSTEVILYVPLFDGEQKAQELYTRYAIDKGGVPFDQPTTNGPILARRLLLVSNNSNLAQGELPYEDMSIIVSTGTYDNLYFSSINNTSVGTSGSYNTPLELHMEINGDATVNNFNGGGSGLLGYTGNRSSVLLYSNISVIVNTSGSIPFLSTTGEANYLGTFNVIGNIDVSILNGLVNKDSASGITYPASLCVGCKGLKIKGNISFNIGQLDEQSNPTIEGFIIGAIAERNGVVGELDGDVSVTLNSGTYKGGIYAIDKKGTLLGNYTVIYNGGTLEESSNIGVTLGGSVYGKKIVYINKSINSNKIEYSDFDTVQIGENANLYLQDVAKLGYSEFINYGNLDFSNASSYELNISKLNAVSVLDATTQKITAKLIIAKGGSYTGWEALLGPEFSIDNNNLVYNAEAYINGWDSNWGIKGLLNSAPVTELPLLEYVEGDVYLPDHPEYIRNGNSCIKIINTSVDENSNIYGGNLGADFDGSSWIYADNCVCNRIIGGNNSSGGLANFTGSTHLYIANSTINHIYGAIHADYGAPTFTGESYISIDSNTSINGWLIGGSVSWHANKTTLNGNTHIYIRNILDGTLSPSDMGGPSAQYTSVVGGSAWLRNASCNLNFNGNSYIDIDIDNSAENQFNKLIIGGLLIGASNNSATSTGTMSGDTHINVACGGTSKLNFISKIIGGNLLYITGNNTVVHSGTSYLNLNNIVCVDTIIGGSYILKGTSELIGNINIKALNSEFTTFVLGDLISNNQISKIRGTIEAYIDGSSINDKLVCGSIESTGSSTVEAENIKVNLNNTNCAILIGGHYTDGSGDAIFGSVILEDVSIILTNTTITGGLYCGTVLQRCSGDNNTIQQGNISLRLVNSSIECDIYLAGGDYINKSATTKVETISTRLELDSGTTFKEGITISGSYVGMHNSSSTIINNKVLALIDNGEYNINSVNIVDFDTVETVNETGDTYLSIALGNTSIRNKSGKGTYKLIENESLDEFYVYEGGLKLNRNVTINQLTVGNNAVLIPSAESTNTNIDFYSGALLDISESILKLKNNSISISGPISVKLAVDSNQTDKYYKIKIISNVSSLTLKDTVIDNDQYIRATDYISDIIDINSIITNFSDAYIKLEDGNVFLTINDGTIVNKDGCSSLQYIMQDVYHNSLFIVKYDKEMLTDRMIIDIKTFIDREKPVGSFVSYMEDVIDV